MGTYFYILIFITGLCLGSFFNVLIFRFNTGRGVTKGRSECGNCRSVIKWFDLVPVLSYLVLKGKCRRCSNKISPLYPIVEVGAAAALLLLFLNSPSISLLTLINALIVALLTLTVFLDIRYLIISDKVLMSLAIATTSSKLLNGNANFSYLLISAFGLTLFFAILFLVSRGKWIGLGDVKFIFLIGFMLGYPIGYLAIISAIWLAAIFSVILLVSGKATPKTEIPFGSFLSVTTIIFIIFNSELQEISRYFY